MTEETTVAESMVQTAMTAINAIYAKGFVDGRAKGYQDGIEAARIYLQEMPTAISTASPDRQEVLATLPLSTKLEDLDFTQRTYNMLKREGRHTIRELLEYSDMQMLDIRNFGIKAVDEVKDKLRVIGYTVREELPPQYV